MAGQKLIRATDSEIVQAFKAICATLEAEQVNLYFSTIAEGQSSPIETNLSQIDPDENLSRLLKRNSVLLQALTLALPSFGNCSVKVQRAEPFDTLRVTFPKQNQPDLPTEARVLAAVDEHLRTFKPTPMRSLVGSWPTFIAAETKPLSGSSS